MNLNIELKSKSKNEQIIKYIIFNLVTVYDIPIFCKNIIIDDTIDYSWSHPEIHISGKYTNKNLVIETFIHEQFHHFESKITDNIKSKSKSDKYYNYISKNYKYTGYEFDKITKYPVLKNFAQHLIVCWNTINIITNVLKLKYKINKPYKKFEKFIIKNFNDIKNDLNKFKAVYKISNKIGKISFPKNEIPDIVEQLKSYGNVVTHRIDKQFGKYKIGRIYNHKIIGNLMLQFSFVIFNIRDSPYYKYQSDEIISLIDKYGKKGIQVCVFKKIK